jgi:DNA-binding transcriptional ArsR family regulator
MLKKHPNKYPRIAAQALMFSALGDKTRLSMVSKLSNGRTQSISCLTENTKLTRQAVTKHLRVLEDAGIIHSIRVGRETQFGLEPKPFNNIQEYLEYVSKQWDDALDRLKSFVE